MGMLEKDKKKKKSTRENGPSIRNENILLPVQLSNEEGRTYSLSWCALGKDV